MEKLVAVVLRSKHPGILANNASVSVPFGWTALVAEMLDELSALPITVTDLGIDGDGLLHVETVDDRAFDPLETVLYPSAIDTVVRHARTLAAWTCVKDSKPAWIVWPPVGYPRPLCPDCQGHMNMKLECARA